MQILTHFFYGRSENSRKLKPVNNMILILGLLIACTCFSCSPSAPVTADSAVKHFMQAYSDEDITTVISLMTQESIMKFDSTVKEIEKMNDNSKTGLCEYYGIKKGALDRISLHDLIKIQIHLMKKDNTDLNRTLTSEAVREIRQSGDTAEVIMSNGMVLCLKREYPYWKIDMTFM